LKRPVTDRLLQRGHRRHFDNAAGLTLTRREIERHARHVGAAETHDLSRWLIAWVWFNSASKDQIGALIECAGRLGRKITPVEAEVILEEAALTPKQMKADDLAKWLGVKYVERQLLGLTRIGAVNVGRRARTVLRKRRDRLAKERKRRGRGARPRSEYEANSLSKTKPWEQLGLSRARWYRLGRPAAVNEAETSTSTAVFLKAEEAPVSMEGKEGVFRGRVMPFAASGPRADTIARCQIIATSAFPAHKSETAKFGSGFRNHFGQHELVGAFICEVIDLQQERAIRQARDGTRRGLLKDWEARRRVLQLLDGGQTKTVKELMAEAALRSRGAADLLLFKLVNDRLVERAGRGIYQIRRVA
jgi:hypothetical protein